MQTPSDSSAANLRESVVFAIGALRSNQDVLLHKVARTLVVKEQLELNRTAIAQLQEDLVRDRDA